MHRVRLIVEYDGTNYVGWQIQPNGIAVQEVLRRELSELLNEDITVHGSGRTDSGVHALAQVVHFDTNTKIPAEKLPYALNVRLPGDIRVKYGDVPLNQDFHARFDVRKKHYRYTVINSRHSSVFSKRYALHVHRPLDIEKMQKAANDILGEHDFLAFKAEGTELKSTVRTIFESRWTRQSEYLFYDICGSGFMYNMVRILVGTMLEIGKGYTDENALYDALISLDRSNSGATAPANGLMMTRVEYDDFDTQKALQSVKLI